MEQIQDITLPQSAAYTTPLRLSPYVRLAIILLSGFALATIGAMAFAQSTVPSLPPFNPYLEYADIFPGQRLSSADGRAYSCWGNYFKNKPASEVSCRFTPASGPVENVTVSISEGIIHQTTFTMRENRFNVGDVVMLFNVSYFNWHPSRVYFFWNNLLVIVSTTAKGHPALLRPVWNVMFTDTY